MATKTEGPWDYLLEELNRAFDECKAALTKTN
jgi:hypothetical protein